MKWPESITVARHGQSAYNILRAQNEQKPEYQEFIKAYDNRHENFEAAHRIAQQLVANETCSLGLGDHDTPLTKEGEQQSYITGQKLSELIEVPDVIFVSPYLRTKQTLGQMALGWSELADVETYEEERVREQEHGLRLVYNDARLFNVMHPEQEKLRKIEGPYWYRYPQGENVPDVRERWRSMLGTFTRDYADKKLLIVTHHLSILALRANLERLGADEFQELDKHQKPVNCGTTIYRGDSTQGKNGRLVLDTYNAKLY